MLYSYIKKFTKRIVPEGLLYAAEPALRTIFSIGYYGNKVYCPVCEKHFSKFILLENGKDKLCPGCGALPRNRLLWLYLQEEIKISEKQLKVLHFSPSRSVMRKMRALKNLNYTTTDYESKLADKRYDITNIEQQNNVYDLVICYHVLEHIEDDTKAMKELLRILKPGSLALLQVPLKAGKTYENPDIKTTAERLRHFGQEDHVRIYGDDFIIRLQHAGFNVNETEYANRFSETEIEQLGLWKPEKIFVCKK